MGEHSFPGWKTRWFCLDFQSRFTYSRRHCTRPWCLIHILRGMVTSLLLIIPRGYSLANLKHLGSWIICVYFITLLRKSKEWSPWLFTCKGTEAEKRHWLDEVQARLGAGRAIHSFLLLQISLFLPGSLIPSYSPIHLLASYYIRKAILLP